MGRGTLILEGAGIQLPITGILYLKLSTFMIVAECGFV